MNYSEGVSGSKILITADKKSCHLISTFLKNYIKMNLKIAKWEYIDSKIILNKIRDSLKKTDVPSLRKIGVDILTRLRKKLKKKTLWLSSICHGDLTLSNIILNKKKNSIILVDFLHTYNDGIVQDLAKLVQEFYLGWSSRYLSEVHKLRSKIIYEKIWSNTNQIVLNKKIKKIVFYESFVTLLRIFPYVHKDDKLTINWARNAYLKLINNKFNFFN